jgi:hypothetical protein
VLPGFLIASVAENIVAGRTEAAFSRQPYRSRHSFRDLNEWKQDDNDSGKTRKRYLNKSDDREFCKIDKYGMSWILLLQSAVGKGLCNVGIKEGCRALCALHLYKHRKGISMWRRKLSNGPSLLVDTLPVPKVPMSLYVPSWLFIRAILQDQY